MKSLHELMISWRNMCGGRLDYGSIRDKLPYELFISGYDLQVGWRDVYPEAKDEFAWALVKDGRVIKEWDRCPSLSDLFDIQKEVGHEKVP